MIEKITLDSSKNLLALEDNKTIDINLVNKTRLLPYSGLNDSLDKNELYNKEKDNCNNFRLLFTINPICSNVLFNLRTEVVKDEGSDDCKALVFDDDIISSENYTNAVYCKPTLNRRKAIQNTEFSHNGIGPYVYHCGIDIFNNHMLKTDDFICINKLNNSELSEDFNTLKDYRRNYKGELVSKVFYDKIVEYGNRDSSSLKNEHLYRLDNIKTFENALSDGLTRSNGWYGFTNKATIEISNGKNSDIKLNKIMNNNKACEIYNLYPDISLFSFIPKLNKYRQRIENNWDYCLTYPSFSDYNKFNIVNENNFNAIRIIDYQVVTATSNNNKYIFTSVIKHNLSGDSRIRLYKTAENYIDINIYSLGNIKGEDNTIKFISNDNNLDVFLSGYNMINKLFFKKLSNGIVCEYYFRKFTKLKNGDKDYISNINKLSYGENIYGDRLAQIIYTENIKTDNNGEMIKNNLGKPLNEIYLTIIKNNKGNEIWYDNTRSTHDRYTVSGLTYSHCFGKISSGLNIMNTGVSDYNIRKIHNVDVTNHSILGTLSGNNIKRIEDNITIDREDFYGDIVEFDVNNYKETILEDVYYRFNTKQRELVNNKINDVTIEELISDDYDLDGFEVADIIMSGMTVQPEGYFYKPHHKIKLCEISDSQTSLGALLNCTSKSWKAERIDLYYLTIQIDNNYNYTQGDIYYIYHKTLGLFLWGTCVNVKKIENKYEIKIETNKKYDNDNFDVILTDGTVPEYAIYNPETEKFCWVENIKPSELSINSEVYDRPYSNNAFYIHNNINLFLQRQDPFSDFELNILSFLDKIDLSDSAITAQVGSLIEPTSESKKKYYYLTTLRSIKNIYHELRNDKNFKLITDVVLTTAEKNITC